MKKLKLLQVIACIGVSMLGIGFVTGASQEYLAISAFFAGFPMMARAMTSDKILDEKV